MSGSRKFQVYHVLRWIHPLRNHILQHFRSIGTADAVNSNKGANLGKLAIKSRPVRREAEAVLAEYFHVTSGLNFVDAEYMSQNTPEFFRNLAKRVQVVDGNVGRSLTRFLRYKPVNEFEPFFESLGLKSSEYIRFLPRNMMFLIDDELLLNNFSVLCNYGIARNSIGRIYKEATEIFQYERGILQSKLQYFENLGLDRPLVAKIIVSTPNLLRCNNAVQDLVYALEMLKKLGIDYDWLKEHILEDDLSDCKCMLELICLLSKLGLCEEQIRELLTQRPRLLLECSGRVTFRLLSLLLKFGCSQTDLLNALLQFPEMSVLEFTNNFHDCYTFLVKIDMVVGDIGWIVRSYPLLLGSCKLKKLNSLFTTLNCGKAKLCEMLKNDPFVLKRWVLGVTLKRLPKHNRVQKARMMKTEFISSIGFLEKSKEMEKTIKNFKGSGPELQERFDCLMNMGFSREEVIKILEVCPQILNRTKDVIEEKIRFCTEHLGIPMSDLLTFPHLVSYSSERVKLRLAMYEWLKNEEAACPKFRLSTLLTIPEKRFLETFVNSHPRGPEIWENLKTEI